MIVPVWSCVCEKERDSVCEVVCAALSCFLVWKTTGQSAWVSSSVSLNQLKCHTETRWQTEQMPPLGLNNLFVCVWVIHAYLWSYCVSSQACWPLWTVLMWSGAPESRTSSPMQKSLLSLQSSSLAWWKSDKVLRPSLPIVLYLKRILNVLLYNLTMVYNEPMIIS